MNSSSILQETQHKAVSTIVHLQRILKNGTKQAGDSYPTDITPSSAPVCKFTPLAQCSRAVDNGQYVGGSSPSGRMAQELFLPFQHTTPFPAPIIIIGGN